MIKNQRHLISLVEEQKKLAYKKNRPCNIEGCKEKAINSHIIWKAGILKPLATGGHLIELNTNKRSRNEPLKFTKTGINEILSFKGFCKVHDGQVFKQVEKNETDFFELKTQILISTRALYHEMRKKEIIIDWQEALLKKHLLVTDEQQYYARMHIYSQNLGIKDCAFYSSELNKEFHSPTGRFIFRTFELELLPLVSSAFFSIENDLTVKEEPLNSVLFSIFPHKDKSYLVIGFQSNYLENLVILERINNYQTSEIKKLVSDILIKQVESWACSIDFYNSNIKPREQLILDAYNTNLSNKDYDFRLDQGIPNMFE